MLFSDVTGVLTVWMRCLVMSLGCWLFECAVQWCHWGADCLNVLFNDVTGMLTVWMCCSMMSLGCWLFECYIQWCHSGADCLNVLFSDVTWVLTVWMFHSLMPLGCWLFECNVKRCHCWKWQSYITWCYDSSCNTFFPKTTSQISCLMWCVFVWPLVTFWGVCWWLLHLLERLCKWKSFVRSEFLTMVMVRIQAFRPATLCCWVGGWEICNLLKDCSILSLGVISLITLHNDNDTGPTHPLSRQAEACKTNTTKYQPQQKLQHTTNWEQDDWCGNSSTQSQAPEDGYINVRNMLSA